MRRLMTVLAAALLVAGPLATGGGAMAAERRDEGRREAPMPNRGDMGRGDVGRGEMGRWAAAPRAAAAPPQAYRGEAYRGGGGYDPRYDPRTSGMARAPDPRYDPRYAPRAYAAPPPPAAAYSAAPRRGGYLGPQGSPVIGDYGRNRLRTPPPGYDWVRTARGMALVSRATGQVFDVVPY